MAHLCFCDGHAKPEKPGRFRKKTTESVRFYYFCANNKCNNVMKKSVLLAVLLCILAFWTTAAPLKNVEVKLTQPDGQVINCFASGDEFYNYLHDAQGFTIVKGEGGFYCYAMHDSQGQVVPSSYRVGSVDPASVGLRPNVKISETEYHRRRQVREQHIQPVNRPKNRDRELNHGVYNNLVVFIRFAGDTYHTTPFSDVDSMFNASNYESISLHNYYHRASYNQLDLRSYCYPEPDGQTILSYEDIYPKEYYMPYDPVTNPLGYQDGETADREFSMLERAIYYVADQVPDTLNLDYNEDGNVDNVVFVIKGQPGEWASLLWPHRWCIYDRYVPLNGLRVYDFNLQLEQGGYFNVSTLCHEMFHSLGAPDLYHYSEGIDPVGSWDLMCGTTEPPQQIGVYMKYKYGNWANYIPDISMQYGTYELEADSWEGNRRNAYAIHFGEPNQFLVLEYRNSDDIFDSHVPDGGLLIYRIDERYDGNAGWNGYNQFDEVYLFRPGGSVNEAGNLDHANFCAERKRTEFSIETDPYMFLTNGEFYLWNERIYNISTRGDKISFTYGPLGIDGETPGPENFNVHVNSVDQQLEFSWSPKEGVDSYQLYRDGWGEMYKIASNVTDTTFVLPYSEADQGYHVYGVSSVSGGVLMFLSSPSTQWAIIGNYETIRLSLTSKSTYGTKGGELEASFIHPQMPTQRLCIYEGTSNEAELYVPANTVTTFYWNAGFDPESKGIRVKATRLNEVSQDILFDVESPTAGTIETYTAADEGLGVISPQHLSATSNGTQIQLNWTVPTENQDFAIYRDGKLCQTVNGSYAYLDDKIMRSGSHFYQVESVSGPISSWNPQNTAHATVMNYYCEPPQNLQGLYVNGNPSHIELNWEEPQFVGYGMLAYDGNAFVGQMGTNSHKWGIKIEPEHLALFAGHPLTHIEMFDCSTGTYTYKIYNGELTNNNTLIYTQQHEMSHAMQMTLVPLDEPVEYDASLPLWITVESSGATEPIPFGDYVGEDNSCLVKAGNNWRPVTYYGMSRSWLLRAYTSPTETPHDFTYNVYWGPEEAHDNEMVQGFTGLTSPCFTQENMDDDMRYNVTAVWDNRETDFSNPVFLGPTVGIATEITDSQTAVFPNPVTDQLSISGKGIRHIALYTITGVKVFEQDLHGNDLRLSMKSFPNGLYLLNILSEEGITTRKVLKQ